MVKLYAPIDNRFTRIASWKIASINHNQRIIIGILLTFFAIMVLLVLSNTLEWRWLRAKYFFGDGIWVYWLITTAAIGWMWLKIISAKKN